MPATLQKGAICCCRKGCGRVSPTAHDEALPRKRACIARSRGAAGRRRRHHQRQDRHRGPVLGHQAGRAPAGRVRHDQARLRARCACSPTRKRERQPSCASMRVAASNQALHWAHGSVLHLANGRRAWILSAARTAVEAMLSTLDMDGPGSPPAVLRPPPLELLCARGRLPKDDTCVQPQAGVSHR